MKLSPPKPCVAWFPVTDDGIVLVREGNTSRELARLDGYRVAKYRLVPVVKRRKAKAK